MKQTSKFILKTTMAFLAAGAIGGGAAAYAEEPNPLLPVVIKIKPDEIFLPPGFDSNDNAQLVVAGGLQNTCLKQGRTTAKVDEAAKKIFVTQEAFKYNSAWCADLYATYVQTVDLGVIKDGKYQVMVNDGQDKPVAAGIMSIAAAKTAEPDSNTYAPIEEVTIEKVNGKRELTLRGTLNSRCTKIDEVKIMQRTPGVIEVLPITDLKEGIRCVREASDFSKTVELPEMNGPTLVHIRSLAGGSVNRVLNLK
ncbi:MAG: hypothetical protein EOP11_26010 [Proteobacteria bacterium]|nr:MAG: hypothetical protein EOP11_26010 [Pseudomonadota bacterium]